MHKTGDGKRGKWARGVMTKTFPDPQRLPPLLSVGGELLQKGDGRADAEGARIFSPSV